jgi:hypothetical protein
MLDLTHQDWTDRASKLRFRDKAFINGKLIPAASWFASGNWRGPRRATDTKAR